jgi:hypothetical protein
MARLPGFLLVAALIATATAQDIPTQLQGRWIIRRIVPTHTVSCWSYAEGKRLIGTEIEYTADTLRWKDRVATHPLVGVLELSAEQFFQEYSGSGSRVTFEQLGIQAATAMRITLTHPDVEPVWGEYAIPGDEVFIKDQNTIVFAVCNVYFEARRKTNREHPRK